MIARLTWFDRILLLVAAGGLFWPGMDYHIGGLVLLLASIILQRRRLDANVVDVASPGKDTRSLPGHDGIDKAPGE
jgi:hypothetical protein